MALDTLRRASVSRLARRTPRERSLHRVHLLEHSPTDYALDTGRIDYDKMEENAKLFRPKLLVVGATCSASSITG
jgi:glycine/serine hydroxymethyltransferase